MGKSDVKLSMEELGVVARYAVKSTQEVLPSFEEVNSEDLRPRLANGAAWGFVRGAKRTTLQRVTARDAHRGGENVAGAAGWDAARAAGDAAGDTARIHCAETGAEAAELLGESVRVLRSPELVQSLDDESVASLESVRYSVGIRS